MGIRSLCSDIMPRKKVELAVETPPETHEPEPKPKARRKKPAAASEPVVSEPIVEAPVAAPAKKPRSRKPAAAAPVAAEPDIVDPDGVLTITFRPPSGRPPTSDPVEAEPVIEVAAVAEPFEPSEDLPILEWRRRPSAAVAAPVPEPKVEADPAVPAAGGRRRRGKRGDWLPPAVKAVEAAVTEEEAIETVAPPVIPTPPPAPEPPKRPTIAIPENAPQVIVRDGVPAIVRDHRVYPPIMFFGNPSDEKRSATVFEEVRLAAEAGIHLHSFLVELVIDTEAVEHSAGFAGYLVGKTLEIDPEAQIILRLEFQAPRGWETKYPNAVYMNAHGEQAEPSICDNGLWGVAQETLALFVRKVRLLPNADHVLGVHLERGEWFLSAGHGFDTSRAAVHQFRDWARRRYSNDVVTLRASWFDGGVSFESIDIPPFDPEGSEGERFIRSSRRQRRYVDYHLFLSDITVSRISELAYTAKSAGDGMLLVGVSYGYTFEWSHPASGHLALGKLLRVEEVDFIGGPPSYRERQPSGTAPFPAPIDSFALNGKIYISEEDFKTSLSKGHEPDDFNPSLKTPQALESVHWRGTGVALAHATGVSWMDLWGNGWLRTHSVWERATRVQQALVHRLNAPLSDPDVAVFIDERALAYLVDSNAFDLLVQNVRESVLRAGVSAGFYLLSDLAHREKFPESRLYLFLNAWDIRPDLRAAIKSRLQRDDKVLFWLYSAGLFDAGRDSLERAREVTGIALKPQPFHSKSGTTVLNRRHPLSEAFPDLSVVGGMQLEPSYFAIPEDGIVLGEYTQTGLPSFVVKDFREDPNSRWTSVFLGEPLVNSALIRALAQMAGAHIWNFHEDVVHVRGPFCTVHCSGTGPRTITLPSKCCAYNLLTEDWAAIDTTHLRFVAIDGSTHVFLVGPRTEIEHLLNTDPSKTLHIDSLPPRELNLRTDTSNFDVPIMKLDEWIEGGDSDEMADEWFLRPQALLEEPELEPAQAEESPEQVGRRRRRRRRGKGGGNEPEEAIGSGEVVTARVEPSSAGDEEFSMNIVFRKRE